MADTVVPSVIVNLKVLSQENYEDWSFRVKTYLLAKGLWKVVEVTTEPPKLEEGEDKFDAWSKRNAKALHTIHISCGDNAYAFIKGISMAKVAWDILAEKFKPTEVSHNAGTRDEKIKPTEEDKEIEEVGGENPEIMNGQFLDDVDQRNWVGVMEFIKIHPEAVRARHPSYGKTALFKAVCAERVDIIKELVHLMTVEDLEIKGNDGNTALASAIVSSLIDTDKKVEIVKCLVEKNNKLLNIVDSKNHIPLVSAFRVENLMKLAALKLTTYICSITPLETLNEMQAAQLISLGFIQRCLDIPLELIRHKPILGITKDCEGSRSPLFQMADTRSAFLSGNRLRFYEQWIYNCIHVEPTPTMDFKKEPATNINDTCINVQTIERCPGNQRHLICSGICNAVGHFIRVICYGICNTVGHFFGELVGTNLLQLVGIARLYRMKLLHVRSLQILQCICDEVLKTKAFEDMQYDEIFVSAIFRAVQLGQVEFMTHIFTANPMFRFITDVDGRNLFQFAAECRQEKMFSLIYGLDDIAGQICFVGKKDKFGNNMLHTIGKFSSLAQTDHIRGAALQMQRELQWFKAVESIASTYEQEFINDADHVRPHELFTQNHRKLVKEGEKSMKETATSCTVVGALIVTIMFAAAFTVPGGNGNKGLPNLLDQKTFKIFIASDAISLFFSTTSVMIFLGMLTSRYAEHDFLKLLPTKMILGLSTLFISIAAMMIAFSSALILMLPGESWIALPAILLSTVPIASFVWMQFPLLIEIFISTYGAGPFDRKVQPWDKDTEQKCSTRKSNLVTKICSSFLCRKVKQWLVGHK